MTGDASKLYGSWLLRSLQSEDLESGARFDPLGPDPHGVLILLPYGRMAAVVSSRDQPMPNSDAERAVLHKQLVAYSGSGSV